MSRIKRKIVRIDEDKCDGCGICAEACHEGAIAIVNGKARLVRESYCDGLGDCIGPCPRDAITIEERDAEEYDEQAVREHLSQGGGCPGSCPGSVPLQMDQGRGSSEITGAGRPSMLTTWPVQITLVPPRAPFLEGSRLLIAADCVPFAFAGFHERFVRGRVVLVGCPKLDDRDYYVEKLTEIFRINRLESVTVVYMEVPCCGALPRLVGQALAASGRNVPLETVNVGIRGDILEIS
jgi:NAD-dependent dihydropyrimidine dehydrogenase PreA subunit